MKFAAPASRKEVAVVSDPGSTTGIRQVTAPSSKPNHPILLPDADDDDDALDLPVALSSAAAPRVAPRPIRQRNWTAALRRPATYLASGLVGAVLVTTLFVLLGSRTDGPAERADAAPATAAPDVATLDRRADTLAAAIAAFTLRGRMYESRRMGCDGLSRGLQQVEDAWLAYNLTRKEAMAATDGTRDQRDQALFAEVRAVEQRFERSSCTRP